MLLPTPSAASDLSDPPHHKPHCSIHSVPPPPPRRIRPRGVLEAWSCPAFIAEAWGGCLFRLLAAAGLPRWSPTPRAACAQLRPRADSYVVGFGAVFYALTKRKTRELAALLKVTA